MDTSTPPQAAALERAAGLREIARPLHRHALEGVLRRLAVADLDHAVVLRGGLLMPLWCAPAWRPTDDLDLLVPDMRRFEPEALRDLTRALCAHRCDDGVRFRFADAREKVLWPHSDWPGLRLVVPTEVLGVAEVEVQIDFGYGAPLSPPATRLTFPTLWGDDPEVLSCTPETTLGWKVHGLFEQEDDRWQQKDLHDLYLLLRYAELDQEQLPESLAVAFSSRGESLRVIDRLLDGEFGMSRGSRRGWRQLLRRRGGRDVPESLPETIDFVVERLRPVVEAARRL